MAAKATLAVAPEPARRLLRTIADSGSNPQAGDAGMSLVNLDRGIFETQLERHVSPPTPSSSPSRAAGTRP